MLKQAGNTVQSLANADATSRITVAAQTFNMSEGAVRVALHRGLGALAKRHRDEA